MCREKDKNNQESGLNTSMPEVPGQGEQKVVGNDAYSQNLPSDQSTRNYRNARGGNITNDPNVVREAYAAEKVGNQKVSRAIISLKYVLGNPKVIIGATTFAILEGASVGITHHELIESVSAVFQIGLNVLARLMIR